MILDTNALSGAADGDPGALEIIAGAERIAVPVIVLGEYRLGIAQSRHRKQYEEWLREWVAAVTVLDVDRETTYQYTKIGQELKKTCKPIPSNDLWIAALCGQHSIASSEPRPPFRCRGRTQEVRMVMILRHAI